MFDFNASLNDAAPMVPMLFPVHLMRMRKNRLSMDVICVLFLLSLLLRFSAVSVLFDFNASLNDAVPMSSISLSFDLIKRVDCL